MRTHGDAPMRGVLAVNPGIPSAQKGRRWVGFKGGSEPGVINLSFLLENEAINGVNLVVDGALTRRVQY